MPKKVLERNARDQKPSTHSQGGDLAGAYEAVRAPARDPKKVAGFLHGVGEALQRGHCSLPAGIVRLEHPTASAPSPPMGRRRTATVNELGRISVAPAVTTTVVGRPSRAPLGTVDGPALRARSRPGPPPAAGSGRDRPSMRPRPTARPPRHGR